MAERFFAFIKRELIDRQPWPTIAGCLRLDRGLVQHPEAVQFPRLPQAPPNTKPSFTKTPAAKRNNQLTNQPIRQSTPIPLIKLSSGRWSKRGPHVAAGPKDTPTSRRQCSAGAIGYLRLVRAVLWRAFCLPCGNFRAHPDMGPYVGHKRASPGGEPSTERPLPRLDNRLTNSVRQSGGTP